MLLRGNHGRFPNGQRPVFTPSQLSGLVQRFMDQYPEYHASTVNSYPILKPEEAYGTLAQPRGQRCALFDGSNDYALSGSNVAVSGDAAFTLCVWVKATALADAIAVIAGGSFDSSLAGYGIFLQSTGAFGLQAAGGNSALSAAGQVSTGQWVHLAITKSAGPINTTTTLYKNGVAVSLAVGASTSTPNIAAAPVKFGTYPTTGVPGGYFSGRIYDARLYSTAKTAAEILAIYNQASTPTTIDRTGLLGGWWFNGESGTTSYDWSGNGKHLTLTNITQSTFHATDSGVTYNPANWLGHTSVLYFDGSNDYGVLSDRTLNGWTAQTISLNFRFSGSQAGDARIAEKGANNEWTIVVSPGGDSNKIAVQSGGTTAYAKTPSTYNDGNWHHLAVTISSTYYIKVYVDGSLVSQEQGGSPTKTGALYLGTYGGSPGSNVFAGQMREFRYYSVEKNASEVAAIATGTVDSSGLLLRYKGDQYDQSGNGRNLTLANGATVTIIPRNEANTTLDVAGFTLGVTGLVSRPATMEVPCVTGDGSAVYAVSGSNIGITGTAARTVAFLAKMNNTSGDQALVGWGATGTNDQLFALVRYGSTWQVNVWGGNDWNTAVASDTNWHWHAVTYDGSNLKWYIDGVLVASTTRTLATTNSAVTLLRRSDSYGLSASMLSAVRIYSDCKTASEVQAIHAGTDNRTNLVAHYPCQEGPGSSNTTRTIHDTVGTNHLTLTNGTVSTIWANRCPYAQDWCINYGGSLSRNRVQYSEQFDNAAWIKVALGASANAVANPIDGGATADALTESATSSIHLLYQDMAAVTGAYTASVYAKANGRRYIVLAVNDLGVSAYGAVFDLQSGVVSLTGSSATSSIQSAGNGWYRCSVTVTLSSQQPNPGVALRTNASDSIYQSYLGDGVSGVYLWGAQLEASSTPSAYQRTTVAVGEGAFLPGLIGSSVTVAGDTKTLSAGKHGNPYSRLLPNTWSAPELVNIGYTSSTKLAPSDTVQATSPADTKFRRNASSGSDRYFATLAALTGTNKTNAEAYVA